MNKLELKTASNLLDLAADQFSNHGCNDFVLENTDENWQLVLDMESWSNPRRRAAGPRTEKMPKRPKNGEPIYVLDWLLMRYLASRLADCASDD